VDRFPECGKPIDLEVGAGLSIDATQVPENLAHLVPIVNKWSFDNLDDQDVFVTHMERHRPGEIEQLNAAFNDETHARFRAWRLSLPFDKHRNEFTAEDWQHPYWLFLNVIKLRETTGGHDDSPAVQEMLARQSEAIRRTKYTQATILADEAFRNSDYAAYFEILSEYEDLLTDTQRKKMAVARRKAAP
jgi:hypothetical protein